MKKFGCALALILSISSAQAAEQYVSANCTIEKDGGRYQSDWVNLEDVVTLKQNFDPRDSGVFNLLDVRTLNVPMLGDFQRYGTTVANTTKITFYREQAPGLVAMLQLPSSPGRAINRKAQFKAQLVVLPSDLRNFPGFALGLGGTSLFYNLKCQGYRN